MTAAAPKSTPKKPRATLPCAGPLLRLSFADSLDPMVFADAAEQEALAYAQHHLPGNVADVTSIALQNLRQWAAASEMVVTASAKGAKALRDGTAAHQVHKTSQRLMPHLIDSKTNKSLEVMKEVGYGRKALSSATAISTIVVSAAHIIATADLARTLKLADQKLDLLLVYRRIDQAAALERIYTSARELLAGQSNESRRMELWRLRGELRQLRAVWRQEFEHNLMRIEDPAQAGWIERTFTRQSTQDAKITKGISGGLTQIAMLEYALRIDCVLAVASDSWEAAQLTLQDELIAIERVGALLRQKARLISKAARPSAQAVVEHLEAVVQQYRRLSPRSLEQGAVDAVSKPALVAMG